MSTTSHRIRHLHATKFQPRTALRAGVCTAANLIRPDKDRSSIRSDDRRPTRSPRSRDSGGQFKIQGKFLGRRDESWAEARPFLWVLWQLLPQVQGIGTGNFKDPNRDFYGQIQRKLRVF